jgi:hypothetical protein
MKNLEELNPRGIMIIIILLSLLLAGLDPLFGQNTPNDSTINLVKKSFPNIYGVIMKEATLKYSCDYKNKELEIKMQCYSFLAYYHLMTSDESPIPRNELLNICLTSLLDNSKNPAYDSNTSCSKFQDNHKNIDCRLSELAVDWVSTFKEIHAVIFAYRLHN